MVFLRNELFCERLNDQFEQIVFHIHHIWTVFLQYALSYVPSWIRFLVNDSLHLSQVYCFSPVSHLRRTSKEPVRLDRFSISFYSVWTIFTTRKESRILHNKIHIIISRQWSKSRSPSFLLDRARHGTVSYSSSICLKPRRGQHLIGRQRGREHLWFD